MPGPWPIPPVRTSIEVKASSLDSDVQELLGNVGFECLRTDERCAASVGCSDRISACRENVQTNLCATPLTAIGSEGGPSQAAHLSESFGVIKIKVSTDLVWQLDFSEAPGRFIRPAFYGRLSHAPVLLCSAAWCSAAWIEKRSGASVTTTRAVSSKRHVPASLPLDLV